MALELVTQRLAACVSIVPGVESVYTWNDQMEVSDEILLIIKTTAQRYEELEKQIKQLHQYTTPEVVALRVERGLDAYLKWLRDSTSPTS